MSLKSVLITVNVTAVALFVFLALRSARNQKAKVPANLSEYYDDETMEGPKLARFQGAAFLFSVVLAASLPMYWLLEPGRQTKMSVDFLKASVERGHNMFSVAGTVPPSAQLNLGCAGCHGLKGVGGAATFVLAPQAPGALTQTVSWRAPSLNDELLRFSRAEVTDIITYGRPGTPMPPWGLAGGGPLPDQAISDLVNYISSIQVKPAEAMKNNDAQLAKIKDKYPDLPEGQQLFMANCARCHTKGWSYGQPDIMGGGGAFGPNLTNGDTLRQFPPLADGVQKQIEFVTGGSTFMKAYGNVGIGSGRMPGFGQELTAQQIQEIVLYERTL